MTAFTIVLIITLVSLLLNVASELMQQNAINKREIRKINRKKFSRIFDVTCVVSMYCTYISMIGFVLTIIFGIKVLWSL